MCFSPDASFASAGVLIPVGIYSLWNSAHSPRFWPLALIPCFFGVQQACEGFVWLGLMRGDGSLLRSASVAYLFFALAFWPTWAWLTALALEPRGSQRRLLVLGVALSTGWFWLVYLPVLNATGGAGSRMFGHSIRYEFADGESYPGIQWLQRVAYVLTCAVPFLLSQYRRILVVQVILGIASAATTIVWYDHAFTSVWCLFAALLSVSIAHSVSAAGRLQTTSSAPA